MAIKAKAKMKAGKTTGSAKKIGGMNATAIKLGNGKTAVAVSNVKKTSKATGLASGLVSGMAKKSTAAKKVTAAKKTPAYVIPDQTAKYNQLYNTASAKLDKQYNNYYNTEAKQLTATNNANKQANLTNRDSQIRNAYRANALQQRALNAQMARQGITGGASETSRLNLANNFNATAGSYRNAATAANAALDSALATSLTSKRLAYQQQADNAKQAERTRYDNLAQAEYNRLSENYKRKIEAQNTAYERKQAAAKTKYEQKTAAKQWKYKVKTETQQRKETQYALKVKGYSNATIDKEIKAIKKSGKNTWRIAYLQAQKNANKQYADQLALAKAKIK